MSNVRFTYALPSLTTQCELALGHSASREEARIKDRGRVSYRLSRAPTQEAVERKLLHQLLHPSEGEDHGSRLGALVHGFVWKVAWSSRSSQGHLDRQQALFATSLQAEGWNLSD